MAERQQTFSIEDPSQTLSWREKWSPAILAKLILYFGVCFLCLTLLPNTIWDPEIKRITYVIGILGVWRYSWWFTHAVRAFIYGHFVYPRLSARCTELWDAGYRPRHLHIMMTTFREHRDITEKVIRGICHQIRDAGVPGTIWLGSGDLYDEDIIANHLKLIGDDLDITLRIIRQNLPGKRMAIGLVLRAMSRGGSVHDDDLVVFMDGDFIIAPKAIQRCMPLFKLYPDLQAVTTDEEVICIGPAWIRSWLVMRFSQRRLAMQSHALAGRVLTLTGRMSVFRAKHVKKHEFIRLLEADHLEHWLWGSFRFLSGDDKSTWYYLLKKGARMLYVPDAKGYTVEVIEGSGLDRMVQNFRRWSGNMLRNGSRAIALGPKRMPFFIWWCIVDQRISMWTMLVSPVLALCATLLHNANYLIAYILFIAITRMMLSLFLFYYAPKVDLTYPAILYFNQLINAMVKVYCLFRLSKQRWSNRGDQSSGFGENGLLELTRNTMASYLTVLYVAMLFLAVIIYSDLLTIPGWAIVTVWY